MAKKRLELSTPEIIADPVPPDAAIEFWKQRAKLTDEEAKALGEGAKQRAFYVTGLVRRDLVQLVSDGIEEALKDGETLADFKKRIVAAIQAQGWHDYRVENIFRTNMQTAYSAGRYKKMQAVKASRPYWQYIAVMDRRVRPSHAILHKKVYPADHEFWASNYPPNGFRCRCGVRTLSEREVKAQGLIVEKEMPKAGVWTDPRTGMEYFVHFPGADKGFKSNPGKDWLDGLNLGKYPPLDRESYAENRQRPAAFGEWVGRLGEKMGKGEFHTASERCRVGTLTTKTLDFLAGKDMTPASPDISIGDSDIFHALRTNKVHPLPLEVWQKLPELLAKPEAIYWDKQKPGLVYVVNNGNAKFIVLVDYQVKVERKKQLVNTVRTGAELKSLEEFENTGRYERIE